MDIIKHPKERLKSRVVDRDIIEYHNESIRYRPTCAIQLLSESKTVATAGTGHYKVYCKAQVPLAAKWTNVIEESPFKAKQQKFSTNDNLTLRIATKSAIGKMCGRHNTCEICQKIGAYAAHTTIFEWRRGAQYDRTPEKPWTIKKYTEHVATAEDHSVGDMMSTGRTNIVCVGVICKDCWDNKHITEFPEIIKDWKNLGGGTKRMVKTTCAMRYLTESLPGRNRYDDETMMQLSCDPRLAAVKSASRGSFRITMRGKFTKGMRQYIYWLEEPLCGKHSTCEHCGKHAEVAVAILKEETPPILSVGYVTDVVVHLEVFCKEHLIQEIKRSRQQDIAAGVVGLGRNILSLPH
jgi:hypothetical protein